MLCEDIRTRTKEAHDTNNRLASVKLALALRDPRLYAQLLLAFSAVYGAFEPRLAAIVAGRADHAVPAATAESLRPLGAAQYARLPKCRRDLEFFYAPDAVPAPESLTPLIGEYVAHMHRELDAKPHVIIAYVHLMYLGLFAGGRIVRYRLAKALKLGPYASERLLDILDPGSDSEQDEEEEEEEEEEKKEEQTNEALAPSAGLEIFEWDGKPEAIDTHSYENEVRDELKRRIDAAGHALAEAQREDIIGEAVEIFRWNARVIDEVGSAIRVPWHLYVRDMFVSFWFWHVSTLCTVIFISYLVMSRK